MKWHIIEGEAGCRYAREHRCTAIVVDALRASATAAALLAHRATEILVTDTVENALALKTAYPDYLLFGERGGLPPDGFDFGNSPQTVEAASGRGVVFTTTTGAQRMIQAWTSSAVIMGTTLNASAAVMFARTCAEEAVVIPAGLATDPDFFAQEDWTAGTCLIMRALQLHPADILGIGEEEFAIWRDKIHAVGLPELFQTAPHAEKLRKIGLDSDIAFCARTDVYDTVPTALERMGDGIVRVGNAFD